jgi:hypothetical protein
MISDPTTTTTTIRAEVLRCRTDPVRFNETILARGRYWWRQREICKSVVAHPITLVPTGNMVGKSHVDAGMLIWFLIGYPGCQVIATAPSQTQLEEVLWKEVEQAYRGSRIPLGGRMLRDPLKIDLGGGWNALAYSTSKVERFAGHHKADLLAVVDEASGVDDPIYEAIRSLNPSRELLTGNPLRPSGTFFDRCEAALNDRNPLANLIQISSLESPHILWERSPWGLADATWLAKSRNDYGEGSAWWVSHVLGRFPDSTSDTVIPWPWLARAADASHVRSGPIRLAIDLATGGGGDRSVLMAGDDNGIVALRHSNTWSFETTATNAALMVQRWGIAHHHVSFDVEGIGADFANRLEAVKIIGARPYRGGAPAPARVDKKFGNRRSYGAWKARQRLDPQRSQLTATGAAIPQTPYAIPPEMVRLMREELQGLRYQADDRGRVCLEAKDLFSQRLKHSPDFADTFGQLHWLMAQTDGDD